MTRQQYISLYAYMAVQATQGSGLFPSVMIAQGILETGNGNSSLASKYKNHFGIKADKSWKGKKVDMNTREVYDGQTVTEKALFRVYDSVYDGFKDRVDFLKENPRYTRAGVFTAATPEEQADRLQAAGYATDPDYASKIKSIIRSSDLYKFDKKKV